MAAGLRIVGLQREVANKLANNRVNLGEPARVVAVIREAWALSPHFSMAAMPLFYLGILAKAHGPLGELDTALDLSDDALLRARALGEAKTLADHACMVLDVHVLTGETDGAARILAGLDLAPLQGLGYIRIKRGFNLFLHAPRNGKLDAARAAARPGRGRSARTAARPSRGPAVPCPANPGRWPARSGAALVAAAARPRAVWRSACPELHHPADGVAAARPGRCRSPAPGRCGTGQRHPAGAAGAAGAGSAA